MGNFFSKKNGFEKQLLDMETKILYLEDKLSNSRMFHQKVLHKIVLYSFAIEFFIILFTYVKSRSLENLPEKLFCCIYLVLFPVFIFILAKVYGFIYKYLIKKNEVKLDNLKTGLQKKLDERKRETDYENTQKLLDRYESIINKKKKNPPSPTNKPLNQSNMNMNNNNSDMNNIIGNSTRNRNQPYNIASQQHNQQQRMIQPQQLSPQQQQLLQQQQRLNQNIVPPQYQQQPQNQQPILNQPNNINSISNNIEKSPSPIQQSSQFISNQRLPSQQYQHQHQQQQQQQQQQQKSKWWLDKLVDYLISDGPTHGSPLICSNCHSHNGYVPVEELSNIQFRCRICKTFNQRDSVNNLNPTNNTINNNENAGSNQQPLQDQQPSIEEIDKNISEQKNDTNNENDGENDKNLEENNTINNEINDSSQNTPNKKKGKGKGKGTPTKKI
ncbi:hypothetical protein RB653_009129 [Dictyostelium firmibasis]|uniref:Endoplasmic reticulum junction formation protein lunapark n=1 Tax=Dictyostelium firmibasis TaxID=79012 RepID=A0AAN7U1F8_9MYCE